MAKIIFVDSISIVQVENGYQVFLSGDRCAGSVPRVFQSKKELFKHLEQHFTFENDEEIENDSK